MKQNQKLQESLVVEICVCLVKLVGSGKSGAGRNCVNPPGRPGLRLSNSSNYNHQSAWLEFSPDF